MFNFAQITNRRIGKITLDVVTNEDHQSNLDISENPIESGAVIADHAVLKPKSVTIVGVMVEHDHGGFGANLPYVGNIRGVTDFLNQFPLPVKVVTQTAQTLAKATRVLSQAAGAVQMAQDQINKVRAIAPFLPDFGLGGFLDSSENSNRIQKCYADLVASQKSGEPIDIQTGIHLYKNMLIESVSVVQSQDGSATFTISAREVLIVDTVTTTSQPNKSKNGVAGKQKSGRAAIQSAPKTQQGATQTKPVEKGGLARHIGEGAKKGVEIITSFF